MYIPFHRPYLDKEEIDAVTECLKSGWLTMGEKTADFENQFSNYIGAKNSIAVNSCTAALHLSLCCSGIEPGDEVIIPANTFTATAEVIFYFKARPVMVDIDRETHIIDAAKIEGKITDRTKAIIPVHYAGQPADMDEILSIAKKHSLFVIEDAAHSLPSIYKDRIIGTIGDATCFSFYATKTITTGEGGMITTENSEWADRMARLRLHGISRDAWKRHDSKASWEYDVVEAGYKYNTTDINSAIGIEQLKKADLMNKMRISIAEKYNDSFDEFEEIIPYKIKRDRKTCWYLYPIKLNLEMLKIDRNSFIEKLKSRKIESSVHFIPLYRFEFFKKNGYDILDFPENEWVYDKTVSLPIFPNMKKNEIDYVINNVIDLIKEFKR